MKSGIYMIKNIENNKKYIGSSKNIKKRFLRHLNELKNNKHHNVHLQRSWYKYGSDKFTFDVIEYCECDELKCIEQLYLDVIFETIDYIDFYYNIGKKATGGDNISNNPNRESIIKNMSDSMKLRWLNISDEDKIKYSEKMSGSNNPNYGNKWSDELRQRVSIIRKELAKDNDNYIKGKTWEEYYGKEKSDELKKNLSTIASGRIGDKNPFYGKKHSDETKKKISDGNRNKLLFSQLKPFTIGGVRFLTLKSASAELDIHLSTIRHRILSSNIKFLKYKYITDVNILEELKEEFNNTLKCVSQNKQT